MEVYFNAHLIRQSLFEDLVPSSLQGGDGTEFRQGDRDLVSKGRVGAEEVVVGDEEGGESQGAVLGGEAAGGTDMVFVSAIRRSMSCLKGRNWVETGSRFSRPMTCRKVCGGWEAER